MTGVQTCALRSEEHTLNSSHTIISYAVFCLKKNKKRPIFPHSRPEPHTRPPPPPLRVSHDDRGARCIAPRGDGGEGGDVWSGLFFFKCYGPHRVFPSSPTRRPSV